MINPAMSAVSLSNTPCKALTSRIDVLTALHLKSHTLKGFLIWNREVKPPVYATVRPLGRNESLNFLDGPFLEVVFVSLPKVFRTLYVARYAVNGEILSLHQPQAVLQTHTRHPLDGVYGDIYTDPLTAEAMGRLHCRGAERIKNNVARV